MIAPVDIALTDGTVSFLDFGAWLDRAEAFVAEGAYKSAMLADPEDAAFTAGGRSLLDWMSDGVDLISFTGGQLLLVEQGEAGGWLPQGRAAFFPIILRMLAEGYRE